MLRMDWLREFNWTIRNIESTSLTDQSEKSKIFTNSEKIIKTNRTIKNAKLKIQLKPRPPPRKQKTWPIPYHLQSYVEMEINELIQSGHLEKMQKVEKEPFVSPVVLTAKKDKSVNITLDSRKIIDSCIKMRPHMPTLEELLNELSTNLIKGQNKPLWISKTDRQNACGQPKLSEDTSRHCNFAITRGSMIGCCRFKKRFYGLSDIPTKFQEKTDITMNCQTLVWIDVRLLVTRRD